MKAIAIMYHDVVSNGDYAASGFEGKDADIYKLDIKLFEKHLNAIAAELRVQPITAFDLNKKNGKSPLLITFDDGGKSAYTHIANALENFGWRGHFFVATDFIDSQAFLSKNEIRELDRRGHVIGSHSASHPLRMANCRYEKMLEEWRRSVEILSDIIGKNVKIASVPGGLYSKKVAESAEEIGIEILFNSEPVSNINRIGKCAVIGRYTIQRKMREQEIAAIARGELAPRIRQYAFWNAKKAAKKLGGKLYLSLRKKLLVKH